MAKPEIVRLIEERALAHPDAILLRFGDERVTWRAFAERVRRAANRLRAVAVEPGDRVALMLANSPTFLYAYYGILAAGAAPVPINVAQRGATLEFMLADSGSVAVVHDDELADVIADVAPATLTRIPAETALHGDDAGIDIPSGSRSGLGILYTSGTTGPPKGVVADGYDLAHIHELLAMLDVAPGETVYTALPLFHGNALILSAMGAIWNDWSLAFAPRFSASRFWDDVRRHEAVSFTALGAMIPILLKQPERPDDADNPARVCLSAGCPGWAWREFEERFAVRLVEFYGMVDYPGYLANPDGVVGSMGKPIGVTEFRIADDGELLLRHPLGRVTHYHNNPQATEEAFRDGWFHTGDLASVDDDGYYYYEGRKKESMRRRGENISAWEIENVVNRHPAVLESAAHAVPSELGGDDVKLVVVVRDGERVTPEELIEFCAGQMAEYAIPAYVEMRDALPKTGTHRVDYARLKQEGVTTSSWLRPGALGKRS